MGEEWDLNPRSLDSQSNAWPSPALFAQFLSVVIGMMELVDMLDLDSNNLVL